MRRAAAIVAGLAVAGSGGVAAVALAAPPANDAPGGATEFEQYSAPKGPVQERQASAELAEATADAGVARCLGASSFERTVWFRVPAADTPRLVRVEGSGGEGDGTAAPDLALYVQPAGASSPSVSEAQACDGPAAGGAAATGSDRAAAVEARVPAGRATLVQVGRSADQEPERVQLSLRETGLESGAAPAGDEAGGAPAQGLGTFADVALGGSFLTQEDPAQPACPAAATVWRRFAVARSGRQTAVATGAAAGTLTAFVGGAPGADNAVGCENRTSSNEPLVVPFDARAGDAVWLRVGADAPARDAGARLGLAGPGEPLPGFPGSGGPGGGGGPGAGGGAGGGPGGRPGAAIGARGRIVATLRGTRSARRAARRRTVTVRVRTTGRAFRLVRVSLQRRVGRRYRTVARASRISNLRVGTRTLRLRRLRGSSGRLRRGTYRVRVSARTTTSPARTYVVSKRYRLRR